MLIQKRGLSNIVFMVKNSILPDDDISSAAMLRMLAEEGEEKTFRHIRNVKRIVWKHRSLQ